MIMMVYSLLMAKVASCFPHVPRQDCILPQGTQAHWEARPPTRPSRSSAAQCLITCARDFKETQATRDRPFGSFDLFLVNNNIQESENIFSIHTESLDRSSYHRSPVYTECSAALPAIISLSLITKMLAYSSLKSGTREHLRLIIMEARL